MAHRDQEPCPAEKTGVELDLSADLASERGGSLGSLVGQLIQWELCWLVRQNFRPLNSPLGFDNGKLIFD